MDEDGFDYMKISFLRDIKAQQRSLRCDHIYVIFFLISFCYHFSNYISMLCNVSFSGTIRRLMLDLSIMMKLNLGMKGAMLHFLVLIIMKLIKPMP